EVEDRYIRQEDGLLACPLCTDPVSTLILDRVSECCSTSVYMARSDEPFALCLRPSLICQHTLKRGSLGQKESLLLNTRGREYVLSSTLVPTQPPWNLPTRHLAPSSSSYDPVIRRYYMQAYFSRVHTAVIGEVRERCAHLRVFTLSNLERYEMKGTY
ncbi:hypothetical protein CVT26_004883, partial [Gymnopilus dilepis]